MTREETALAVLDECMPALRERYQTEALSGANFGPEGDQKRREGAMKLHLLDQILIHLQQGIRHE